MKVSGERIFFDIDYFGGRHWLIRLLLHVGHWVLKPENSLFWHRVKLGDRICQNPVTDRS